jgi:hypothetical protein
MWELYFPPSLRSFEQQRVLATEYMCLEYDLVEALRPRFVVDLGTGNASAFFVFCQAMRDYQIDGMCFAVDPWPADDSIAEEDDWHSLTVNHHARNYYRGITLLMKMEIRAALAHFDPGSIDLLRIDLGRVNEPLRELVDAWLPRLAPGGAVMCFGLNSADTESRRTWNELLAREAGHTFEGGAGLGVVFQGALPERKRPSVLLEILSGVDAAAKQDLEAFYAYAADHLEKRRKLRKQRFNLFRKKRDKAAG